MIYQLLVILSLTLHVFCQYSSTLSTTPAPQPPAQVHYVNIGADLAGDYKFGYDTGKGPNGQSFREETRAADGTVRGAYGYTDANGQQRIVKYSAGKDGFKIEDDSPAGGSAPAPTAAPYRPAPTQPPQVYRPPQTLPPQTYRAPSAPSSYSPSSYSPSSYSPSSSSNGNYLELNARPAQTYRAPAPAQTLRSLYPSSYPSSSSSSALSNSLSSYSPSSNGLSSSSLSGSSGSSISYPSSQPSLQTYRAPSNYQSRPAPALSQPNLRSYSGLATTPRPEEETWGPPVINTALLSYNIGAQGSLPVSYLSTSSSSSRPVNTYRAPLTSNNDPVLRSYSGLSPTKPLVEEKWGPPVINTALLSYNIGSQH